MESTAFLGTIIGVIVALGGFVMAYFSNSTRLMKRVDDLSKRVFELHDQLAASKMEVAELASQLKFLQEKRVP